MIPTGRCARDETRASNEKSSGDLTDDKTHVGSVFRVGRVLIQLTHPMDTEYNELVIRKEQRFE